MQLGLDLTARRKAAAPVLAVLVLAALLALARDVPATALDGEVSRAATEPAAPNAICPPVPDLRSPAAQVVGFARLAGIPGESADARHPNEIDIVTLTLCATQVGGSVGGGTGRPVLDDVVIGKHLDRATVPLFAAATTGRHVQNAVITLERGAARFRFFQVRLEDVVVTRVNSSWQNGAPEEQVALGYTRICWDYTPQTPTGQAGPTVSACFNRATGLPTT